MNRCRSLLLGSLLLASKIGYAADPFLGRWELDVAHSHYAPGACPKHMTIEMTQAGDGVHYHSETELQSGRSFTADYTAAYNGVPVMVTGAKSILLPVALHRESARVVVASYTSGAETRAVSRRIVAQDGRTMTVTTTSRDGTGHEVKNVGVYRRSAAPHGLPNLLTELQPPH